MLEKFFNKDKEIELNKQWEPFAFLVGKRDKRETLSANQTNALLFNTVYSCINVLSDDIAKLPFKAYKKTNNEIQVIENSDVHRVLRVRPNVFMSPFTFLKLAITDICISGNFYAYIERNLDGSIKQLLPLTASQTLPVVEKGKLFYYTTFENKGKVLYDDQVLHFKGMSRDGIYGMSPIEAMRVQMESNDIASKFNQDVLEDGGFPSGVIKVPSILKKEAKEKVRESWDAINKRKSIAIIDNGMDYQQLGFSQSDMQWLEAQKFNNQQIAGIFKVPLHKINDLERATYTNIEHQSLDYVKNTLQPLVTQIEEETTYKLFTEKERLEGNYVKFNMDSELRGDSKARAEVNAINLANGFATINEIRALNEQSKYSYAYADEPLVSLNLAPLKNVMLFQDNHFGKKLNGADEKGGDDGGDEEHKDVEDEAGTEREQGERHD